MKSCNYYLPFEWPIELHHCEWPPFQLPWWLMLTVDWRSWSVTLSNIYNLKHHNAEKGPKYKRKTKSESFNLSDFLLLLPLPSLQPMLNDVSSVHPKHPRQRGKERPPPSSPATSPLQQHSLERKGFWNPFVKNQTWTGSHFSLCANMPRGRCFFRHIYQMEPLKRYKIPTFISCLKFDIQQLTRSKLAPSRAEVQARNWYQCLNPNRVGPAATGGPATGSYRIGGQRVHPLPRIGCR